MAETFNVSGSTSNSALSKKIIAGVVATLFAGSFFVSTIGASAVNTVYVTPDEQQGWSQGATTGDGVAEFVSSDSPLGSSSLFLSTGDSNLDRAQFVKSENVALADVDELGYWTKQVSASSGGGSASFQLAVDLNGDAVGGFTTLVHEPYWQNSGNPDGAPVVPGEWQEWDADSGLFWSSRSVEGLVAGAGGAPFYQLDDLKADYPDAVVLAYGVNVGTYNRNYEILVDGVTFNDTLYDFELTAPDVSAPDVMITAPTDGASVYGDVDVRATIQDDNELLRYNLVVRDSTGATVAGPGVVNVTDSFEDQSLFTLDTITLNDGVYTVFLAARDAAGNRDGGSQDSVAITVNNVADNKQQCKDGGWMTFAAGYKNQGQCVSSFVRQNNR